MKSTLFHLFLLGNCICVESFSVQDTPFSCASFHDKGTGTRTSTDVVRGLYKTLGSKSTSTSLHEKRRGTELSRYKTRSAILQHTLQMKQKEYKTQDNKLLILQDVIQKLQSSNKNLLQKVQELQQERDGIHIQPESDEIWPPEMGVQLMKEEFLSKEVEWENALNTAQVKYQKLRKKCQAVIVESQEKDADIQFYQERAQVDESEMALLRNQIKDGEESISKLQDEMENLKKMPEKEETNGSENAASNENKSINNKDDDDDDEKDRGEHSGDVEKNYKLIALQSQVEDLTNQIELAKNQILELSLKWKTRREEMQRLIEKEQEKILALQDKLSISELEQASQQERYKKLEQKFTSLQNSTDLAFIEKENLSKESLEIATAAVKQAEEREKELKKELNSVRNELSSSTKNNNILADKISSSEIELKQIQELQQKENEATALSKKLQMQIEEIECSERLKWEKMISDQKIDYDGQIEGLKSQIEAISNDNGEVSGQNEFDDNATEIGLVPIPRKKRLRRLANRIKSVLTS